MPYPPLTLGRFSRPILGCGLYFYAEAFRRRATSEAWSPLEFQS